MAPIRWATRPGRCPAPSPAVAPVAPGRTSRSGCRILLEQCIEVGRRVCRMTEVLGAAVARPCAVCRRPARPARLSLRPRRAGGTAIAAVAEQELKTQGNAEGDPKCRHTFPDGHSRSRFRGNARPPFAGSRPGLASGHGHRQNRMSGSDHGRRPALVGAWPPPNYCTAT